jgi:drug/metabolite transporter (DMT)-like permease
LPAARLKAGRPKAAPATTLSTLVVPAVSIAYEIHQPLAATLRRLPPAVASMATLLTPLVGVVAAALALGEPLGAREALALALTLGGVFLALRKA